MKILIASTSVPGHLEPLLGAGNVLNKRHDVAVQVSEELRPTVEMAALRYLSETPDASTFASKFAAEHPGVLERTSGNISQLETT